MRSAEDVAPYNLVFYIPLNFQFAFPPSYNNDPTDHLRRVVLYSYSSTLYAHHAPLVKSGKATGMPPLAMDSSERAVTAIQAAPS